MSIYKSTSTRRRATRNQSERCRRRNVGPFASTKRRPVRVDAFDRAFVDAFVASDDVDRAFVDGVRRRRSIARREGGYSRSIDLDRRALEATMWTRRRSRARHAVAMAVALAVALALALAACARETSALADVGCGHANTKKQLFVGNNQAVNVQVDVRADGAIAWGGGAKDAVTPWLSVSNVIYPTRGRTALSLTSGWTNTGGEYQTAEYACADSVVSLTGVVQKSTTRAAGDVIATLPEGCRPANGRLAFTARDADGTARVDVDASGNVRWMSGAIASGKLISLSGVTFSTSAGSSLTFANGWSDDTTDGFAPLRYTCEAGLVIVSGRVKAGTWNYRNCIATLPANCRPITNHLLFSVNNEQGQARLSVWSDGCFFWEGGGQTNSRISLSGVTFRTEARDTGVVLDWGNHGNDWNPAAYSCTASGLVVVEGLVLKNAWSTSDTIFRIPSPPAQACALRPPGGVRIFSGVRDESFSANVAPSRFDVTADGQITIPSYPPGFIQNVNVWQSLSNIHWSNDVDTLLTLENGWVNFGYQYSAPSCTSQGGVVTLSGLLRPGNWNACIARLPPQCRPRNGHMLFSVNTESQQSRVRVSTDGCIFREAGPTGQGWLSLSGIVFAIAQVRVLVPHSNAVNYGFEWAPSHFSCVDGFVILGGLLRMASESWQPRCVAYLPAGCRPRGDLSFVMNQDNYGARIDVRASDGCVKHAGGQPRTDWVSLAGMAFATSDGIFNPVQLNNQKYQNEGSPYAGASFACARGITILSGRVQPLNGGDANLGVVDYFSPPPPSPPPPPPPGSRQAVQVIVSNAPAIVSSYSFGFGVKVSHSACTPSDDCFQTIGAGDVGKRGNGLRCKVRVQKIGDGCSDGYGAFLPCRQWDDFFPKALEMTDSSGKLVDGDYTISYSCYFELSDGSRVSEPVGNWVILHTFKLLSGCQHAQSVGSVNKLENVATEMATSRTRTGARF